MEVGVREAKERLSEYLDRAAAGEVIKVTDRGIAKALLGPLAGTDRIEQGIAEGWISPGNGAAPAAARPARPAPDAPSTQQMLEEDRADRL